MMIFCQEPLLSHTACINRGFYSISENVTVRDAPLYVLKRIFFKNNTQNIQKNSQNLSSASVTRLATI